jgi:hypothetical protein
LFSYDKQTAFLQRVGLHLLSNIDMQNRKAGFAVPLSKTSRLLGAIEITNTKLLGYSSITPVLLALLEVDGELTAEQRSCHSRMLVGPEKRKELKTFFWKIYNDEEAICAYLNRKISIKYFKKNKSKGETDTDVSIRNILESGIGFDLLMKD